MALAEADKILDKYRFRPGYAAFQTRHREAIHRGWTERRQTDPKQMVSSLKYAAKVEESEYFKEGSFLLPYHKLVNGEAYQLSLRHHNPRGIYEKWSIDFGNLVGDNFLSRGWMDFEINTSTSYRQDQMKLNGPIASTNDFHQVFEGNVYYPERALRDKFGLSYKDGEFSIFVDPKLRGQKVGLSLVNAARVVAAERGAKTLTIDQGEVISNSRDKAGEGFLANLGYPALDKYPEYPSLNGKIIVIPTQDRVGQRQNYSFDFPVPPGSYPYKFI